VRARSLPNLLRRRDKPESAWDGVWSVEA